MNITTIKSEAEAILNQLKGNTDNLSIIQQIRTIWMKYLQFKADEDAVSQYKTLSQYQRVAIQFLKKLQRQLVGQFPWLQDAILILLDKDRQYSKQDFTTIMKSDLRVRYLQPNQEMDAFIEQLDYLIDCINNIGVIEVQRHQVELSLNHFYRAQLIRQIIIPCEAAKAQGAIIQLNIAYSYHLLDQADSALQLLTGAVSNLETAPYHYRDIQSLIQIYMPFEGDEMTALLCSSYKFMSNLLQKQGRNREASIAYKCFEELRQHLPAQIQEDQPSTNRQPKIKVENQHQKIDVKPQKKQDFQTENKIMLHEINEDVNIVFRLYEWKECIEILVYSVQRNLKWRRFIQLRYVKGDYFDKETYKTLRGQLKIGSEIELSGIRVYNSIAECQQGFNN